MFQGPDLEKPYQDVERGGAAIHEAIEKEADEILFQAGTDSDYCEGFVEHLFTEVSVGQTGPLVRLVALLANNLRDSTLHTNGVTLLEMGRILREAALKKAEYQI